MKKQIHVYLVSDEPIANISPALDMAVRPDKVFLIVSPQMKKHAMWLKDILQAEARIEIEYCFIQDAWDLASIRQRLIELLTANPNDSLTLNASCGTKPMLLAAFEVFRDAHNPVFFVQTNQDKLYWLYPRNRASHDLADRVKLKHFLRAYGTEIDNRGSSKVKMPWQQLGQNLIDNIETFSRHIGTLNWLAQRAEGKLISSTMSNSYLDKPDFRKLLTMFREAGIFAVKGNRLEFPNEEARFFTNGGWLEQTVFALIQSLQKNNPQIQDLSQSLEVSRQGQEKPVRNELDVVILCNNKLYIIECKTKRFKSIKHADSPGAEALYKIDTLQDVFGGLNANGMLLSYLRFSDYDRSRAKDLNIRVCDYTQLIHLRDEINQWMQLV